MTQRLEITFPLNSDFYEISKKIEKTVGKPCEASGAGLGERDMSWSFPNMAVAQKAALRVRKLNISGLRTTIMPEDVD